MAERHILLTAYSVITSRAKETQKTDTKTQENMKLLSDNRMLSWELAVENTDYESLYLNSAYTTAESAFKELTVPNDKRTILKYDIYKKKPIYDIEAVFAFTTVAVKSMFTMKDIYYHDEKPIPLVNADGELRYQTHQEFIEDRLKKVYAFSTEGERELLFKHSSISDDGVNPNESIKSVLEMVNKVENYAKQYPDDTVIIHADMSGGFRHIPFILMMVLNILQRAGYTIGELIYTMLSKGHISVERINDIFDMQRFTNGIHEFIEFGSGEELDRFYSLNKEKSDCKEASSDYDKKIDTFISAVKNFSEAITFSDRTIFQNAVKGIEQAWRELEGNITDTSLEDLALKNNLDLLKTFSPRIKEEYELLWNPNSVLDYIHWCLKHNFIQQALTLYIELIPEVLLNKNKYQKEDNSNSILQVIDRAKMELEHEKSESPYTLEYYLLNQYSANVDSKREEKAKNSIKAIGKKYLVLLEKFLSVKRNEDIKWFVDIGENIREDTLEEFFQEANRRFHIDDEFDFILGTINNNKAVVKVEECKNNWVWLLQMITNPLEGLYKTYKETLKTLEMVLSNIEAGKYKDEASKMTVSFIERIWYKECLDYITKKEHDRYDSLLGYICLHKTWSNNLKTLSENLYGFDLLNMARTVLHELDHEIDTLKANGKKRELRINYLIVGQISLDEISPIILPYTVKEYTISQEPAFDKEIANMDAKSKVDNIQAMIDGDGNDKKNNNSGKIMIMNPELLKKLSSKLDQLEFSSNIIALIEKSMGNEAFNNIKEHYQCLIPSEGINEVYAKDMWDRDTLSLLVLRSILYPYYELKLIRNDSVHAREVRHKEITKTDVKILIEKSLNTIEKYLELCKG